ncbi:MAG: hypothetical protein AB8B92_11015 [Gammaproteobacteria bacterium]
MEWNHRIILVHATGDSEEILRVFEMQDDDIQDRDIYWFIFLGESLKTNYQGELKEKFFSATKILILIE